jgi:hypothetical protein
MALSIVAKPTGTLADSGQNKIDHVVQLRAAKAKKTGAPKD